MNFLLFTVVPAIIAVFLMRKENESVVDGQTDDSPLEGSLWWYVFLLCLLAPLFSQLIFYYGWKKKLPTKAKKANTLGWISIAIWVVAPMVLGMMFGAR